MDLWVQGTAQEFAKFMQLAGSFLSHYVDDSLGTFYFYFISHTCNSCNSALSQIFSPKIQHGVNGSQISYLGLLATALNPGNFYELTEIDTYEKTTLGR